MVKQIWMSQDTKKKSRYGLHTLGGILGIVTLALLLIGGGTALGFFMEWPTKWFSLILWAGVTALMVVLAVRLGRRSVKDSTVFFLTEEDRLFVIDARCMVDLGDNVISYTAGTLKTQRFLERLAQSPHLPAGADEILRVEKLKENRSHYVLVCQVRHPNQRITCCTYLLIKGMEDQELLLRQLERREGWAGTPEIKENRNLFYLLISILVCCCFVTLCVLSHPVLARLPQNIYFPCLGAAFAALFCAVWFGIRQHRGE